MNKIRDYAKAIAALLGAVATFLVSVNAPPEWSGYLASAVAILTGVATFGVRNGPKDTGPVELPVPPPPMADVAIDAIQRTIQDATHATSEADRVRQVAIDVLGGGVSAVGGPLVGSLAEQVIGSLFPKQR
jgi:hypothetical protein